MRGSTFLPRYATSTDSNSGECPEPSDVKVAFHCTNRAAGEPDGAPLADAIGVDHGLQFFCGWSMLPLRVAIATCPPLSRHSKLTRPHSEYIEESKTSLSMVPSRSTAGPTSYTLPTLPVAAYSRPSCPGWNAVTCVAGTVSRAVNMVGDSRR